MASLSCTHHMQNSGVGRSSVLTTSQTPAHAPAKQGHRKQNQPSSAFSCGSGAVLWSASGAATPQRALWRFPTSCVKTTNWISTRRALLCADSVGIPVQAAARQTCFIYGCGPDCVQKARCLQALQPLAGDRCLVAILRAPILPVPAGQRNLQMGPAGAVPQAGRMHKAADSGTITRLA